MYGRWGLPCARRSGRVMCVAAREYLPAGLAIAVRACQPVCVCRALERWLERARNLRLDDGPADVAAWLGESLGGCAAAGWPSAA